MGILNYNNLIALSVAFKISSRDNWNRRKILTIKIIKLFQIIKNKVYYLIKILKR